MFPLLCRHLYIYSLEYYSDALTKTTDRDEAYTKVIIRQASQTAAHELGHLLSLRHHDSFGPPGGGLHPVRTIRLFVLAVPIVVDGSSIVHQIFVQISKYSFKYSLDLFQDFPFSAFYPTFDGLAEGDETFLHIMGKSAKKNSGWNVYC